MSEVYRGVLVKTDEATAREQFALLKSDSGLRLAALREDIYGFYNKKSEGTFDELQSVATHMSQVTGSAVVYLYDSRVGFVFEIYESGELKQSNNYDDTIQIEPFKALAVSDLTDDDVEAAFHWDRGELLIDD